MLSNQKQKENPTWLIRFRLNAPYGAGCFLTLLRLAVGLRAPLHVVMHLMVLEVLSDAGTACARTGDAGNVLMHLMALGAF